MTVIFNKMELRVTQIIKTLSDDGPGSQINLFHSIMTVN